MPTSETTFNAIGGIMQAWQESLSEKQTLQLRVAQLEKENEGLRQAVADLGKRMLRDMAPQKSEPGPQSEPPDDGTEAPIF